MRVRSRNKEDIQRVISVAKISQGTDEAEEKGSEEDEGGDDFNENLGILAKNNSDMLPFTLRGNHSEPETSGARQAESNWGSSRRSQ